MSYAKFGMTLVLTIATPIVGWMMDRTGYGIPFAIGAVVGVISAAVFGRVRAESVVTSRTSFRHVVTILN
jgi:hypothetical protein